MAAKGHKQYEYSGKALAHITKERTGNIVNMAEAKVESEKDFLTPYLTTWTAA